MSYLKGLAEKVNSVEAKGNFRLMEIDVEKLVPSSQNFYGIREVDELAQSIKESGLMHNLVVRKLDDGKFEILSGERRYHALKQLEYKKVPCQVKEISELDGEILLIQANSKQRELSHLEKMKGVERLRELYKAKRANGEEIPKGKTRDLIGKDIGLSGVQVGRYMKVADKLIDPLKEKLDDGSITLTQASTLSNLKNDEQEIILDQIDKLDIKECKQEVDILVEGIKQPVNSELDKQFLVDISGDENILSSDNNSDDLEVFKEFLNIEKSPRVVLSSEYFEGILYTQDVKLNNDELTIKISGFGRSNVLRVRMNKIKKVTKVQMMDGRSLDPKQAFRVTEEVYFLSN